MSDAPANPSQPPAFPPLSDPVVEPPFFNLRVLRNASIALVLSLLGGLMIGLLGSSIPVMTAGVFMIFSNMAAVIACGFVSALTPKGQPLLKHLAAVTIVVWVCGLLNVALGLTRLIHWIFQPVVLIPAMALGAGLAWLARKVVGK